MQLQRDARFEAAGNAYASMLRERPNDSELQYFVGLLRFQQGDVHGALTHLELSRSLGLDTAQANANLAMVYLRVDRLEEASEALHRSLQMDGKFATAYGLLGLVRQREGRFADAQSLLEQAVRCDPGNPELSNNLGGILRDQGHLEEAIACFRKAVELSPTNAEIWCNLGSTELQGRRWSSAELSLRSAITLSPAAPRAWSRLGSALSQQGKFEPSIEACRQALVLEPDSVEAQVALSGALANAGFLEEAEDCVRGVLARDSFVLDAWIQLAAIHTVRAEDDEAEACLRQAVAAEPRSARAKLELARTLVGRGVFREGFEAFESRFEAIPDWFTTDVREAASRSRYSTIADLRGANVLVLGEQGFGDQIMMLRYLPLLRERGVTTVQLACAPELVRLASRLPGVDDVRPLDAASSAAEGLVRIPALSLPRLLSTAVESIPELNVVEVLPEERARAEQWLSAAQPGLRVGLVWAGNSTRSDPARYTFGLSTLRPLLDIRGLSFVSLQAKADPRSEIDECWIGRLLDPMGDCLDFLDTASVVSCLDLVISVDTAVAHLSGSMNAPTWLILKAGGEWRWGTSSPASPWYPSMRIFRQQAGEPWDVVVDDVFRSLDKLSVERHPSSGNTLIGT